MTKPFLLYGGSSSKRKDWATDLSSRNGWIFYEIDKKTFEREIFKSSITTSLGESPNIIFLSRAENMSAKDLAKFFELIKNSPHRIVLSANSISKMPKTYKDQCNVIRIGESFNDNFFGALSSIMNEPDREKVRWILEQHKDKIHVFYHILKNSVWKSSNPQALRAIERGMQLFYKVNNDFLISILAYSFPVGKISLSYDKKQNLYKEEISILDKMRSKLRLSELEAVETYECVKEIIKHPPANFASQFIRDLGLEKKEIEFLGLPVQIKEKISSHKSTPKTPVASHPPPKINNLSKWM